MVGELGAGATSPGHARRAKSCDIALYTFAVDFTNYRNNTSTIRFCSLRFNRSNFSLSSLKLLREEHSISPPSTAVLRPHYPY